MKIEVDFISEMHTCKSLKWDVVHPSSKIMSDLQFDEIKSKYSDSSWKNNIVTPFDNENLGSWLLRQSWRFELTIKELLFFENNYWTQRSINPSISKINDLILSKLEIFPMHVNLGRIFQLRGIDFDLKKLQVNISKWIDITLKKMEYKRTLKEYFNFNLKYCSICWKSDNERYFRKEWRYPFVQMRLTHGTKLIDRCPNCNNLLFDNLANLEIKDLVNCQYCDNKIINDEDTLNHENSIAQKGIFDNIVNNKVSFFSSNSVFGIPFDEISDDFMNILITKVSISSIWGIEIAKYVTLKFNQENKRKPNVRDIGMEKIRYGTKTNNWRDNGVKTWNDLLELVFGETNLSQGIYTGKNGLDNAINEFKEYYEINKKYPTSRDMPSISTSCMNGYWKQFGIESWNDLLLKVFDDTNIEKGIYHGLEGFKKSKVKLVEYYEKTGKIPSSTIKELSSIVSVIKRGIYSKYGIDKWNDMLELLFRTTNHVVQKYVGLDGLRLAKHEINNYYSINNKIPTSRNKGMRSIVFAAQSGRYWVDFEINSWNELLISIFGLDKVKSRIKRRRK
ncbi:MAG: hypothetical protein HeimC2_40130 [Candidatus Heimdallarchaeota archaeon LC_2]|nr:MAG: hypothetical protein HeimC2_40130 [Candidatus Heimdallarchaeota archaeon LC_2]